MVVTIDGPAGAGKSTVARAVAERLGYRHVDTGEMYRELTAVAIERGVDLDDAAALAALVGTGTAASGRPAPERISANVSAVSRHEPVRERMRARQRELARDAVLEGRDTGTRVCPDAEVKMYLTASVAERARRRASELGIPAAEVEVAIAERDRGDAAQLAPAPDAHTLDTTGLDAERVIEQVLDLVARCRRDEAADLARYDRAWWILRRTAGLLARVLLRPRVIGRRNIPATGPVLIVSNHESWWDIPALGVCSRAHPLHGQARALRIHVALAWLLAWGGAFAVRRGEADRDALRSVHETLEAGGTVGIFIQGHRQAELDGAKAGAGRCAVVEDGPVVPGGDPGHRELAPGQARRASPSASRAVYERGERRPGDAYRETADELMAEIRRMYELAG